LRFAITIADDIGYILCDTGSCTGLIHGYVSDIVQGDLKLSAGLQKEFGTCSTGCNHLRGITKLAMVDKAYVHAQQ
jgi:hypothetical protein